MSDKVHRIAVYGSLRKGEYNYREAMGEPICTGHITKAQLFSLGAFPCIVATDNDDDKVVVEVYDLTGQMFEGIDNMEAGAGYHRCAVSVIPELDGEAIDAEAYFYPEVKDWFGPRIENGDWNKR